MANTCTLIESTSLTGQSATVTFGAGNTIPQTYTDLLIFVSARSTGNNGTTTISFNGSGTTQVARMYGDGTTPAGDMWNTGNAYYSHTQPANYVANTFGNFRIYIPNYTSSNAKALTTDAITENNATAAITMLVSGYWSSTSAINQITLGLTGSENFAVNSTFYLYGIKNS